MAANGEQVRFANWFDAVERNGNNYNPNSPSEAIAKFADGKYLNELYVYVGDDGKLDITINKSNYMWDCWVLFNITAIDGNIVTLTELSDVIPAGTGVILNGPADTYKFNILPEANYAGVGENLLLGSDEIIEFEEEGYKFYMLSTNTAGKVGFYLYEEGGERIVNGAHKAFLRVKKESDGSNADFYLLFNEADGIDNAAIDTENGNEVYTISGVRVNGQLKKGVYIMNGKKVIIK